MHTLSQVYLLVSDLGRSVDFYSESLEFDRLEHGETSATFDTGHCHLVVEEDFDEATLAEFGLSPPPEDRGSGAILVITVDDVDAVYERASSTGAETLIEPRDVDWGRRLFLVRDPDGYVLEISKPLDI